MAGGGEAGDVPDLGDDEEGDEEADTGDAGEDGHARVVLGAGPDLSLDGLKLAVEVGDESEQALEPAPGRRGQRELTEEGSSFRPEELGAAVLDSLAGEQGVDAVLERGTQAGERDVVAQQLAQLP